MAVPKPPNFNAVGWRDRLKEAIPKNAAGQTITVWDQIVEWTKWQRLIRDHTESNRIQLVDHKIDLDTHTERLNKQADRLAVLEARPTTSPFPGSPGGVGI